LNGFLNNKRDAALPQNAARYNIKAFTGPVSKDILHPK